MSWTAQAEGLGDLARVCGDAPDARSVLAGALPVLRSLAGCTAVVAGLADRESDEVALREAPADLALDLADLDLGDRDGGAVVRPPVPPGWAAAGVHRVMVVTMPRRRLRLAWVWRDRLGPAPAPPVEPEPLLETAALIVQSSLDRIASERQLADLTQRVDTAQRLAHMGDYDWHIASDTTAWSDQLFRIYGHEPQSFQPSYERFLDQVHPDDRARVTAIHQQSYATGEAFQLVERIIRPDGQIRYLSTNGQVVMDERGAPVRMRGTCVDVTDRILAEEAQERSAARFRSLVESCPDAILVADSDGRIRQANRRAHELLCGDPVGHRVEEVLPAGDGTETGTRQALEAIGLDGRSLRLDVTVAELADVGDGHRAVFLHDAAARLAGEALSASLREAQLRRMQALEINDNVVQGLTAALYALEQGNVPACSSFLARTMASARRMMDDLLQVEGREEPPPRRDMQPGELVRSQPASLGDHPVLDLPPAASRGHAGRRRILIVDDSPDVRMLLRLTLEAADCWDIVGEAEDGEEAVQMATVMQPHLVVLDLAMPRMDGLEALPLIREAVPDVQVIVLSGFDRGTMAEKVLDAGAARYVEKGTALSELTSLVHEVFEPAGR